MAADDQAEREREFHELSGAADVLTLLREEFEQWLEEAQDDSKQEALANVLGHIESMEIQYTQRRDEAHERLQSA